jgi:hypothetical protein
MKTVCGITFEVDAEADTYVANLKAYIAGTNASPPNWWSDGGMRTRANITDQELYDAVQAQALQGRARWEIS